MSPILKIKENTQTLICGKAGSGKTNMLMNYIILHDGIFDNIYVCCDSPDEPLYELLKSYGDNIKVLRPDSFPEIDEFEYTSSHNSPKYLIVQAGTRVIVRYVFYYFLAYSSVLWTVMYSSVIHLLLQLQPYPESLHILITFIQSIQKTKNTTFYFSFLQNFFPIAPWYFGLNTWYIHHVHL